MHYPQKQTIVNTIGVAALCVFTTTIFLALFAILGCQKRECPVTSDQPTQMPISISLSRYRVCINNFDGNVQELVVTQHSGTMMCWWIDDERRQHKIDSSQFVIKLNDLVISAIANRNFIESGSGGGNYNADPVWIWSAATNEHASKRLLLTGEDEIKSIVGIVGEIVASDGRKRGP